MKLVLKSNKLLLLLLWRHRLEGGNRSRNFVCLVIHERAFKKMGSLKTTPVVGCHQQQQNRNRKRTAGWAIPVHLHQVLVVSNAPASSHDWRGFMRGSVMLAHFSKLLFRWSNLLLLIQFAFSFLPLVWRRTEKCIRENVAKRVLPEEHFTADQYETELRSVTING